MKFYDPTVVKRRRNTTSFRPSLTSLEGKVVGILSNGWASFEDMIARFQERLQARYKVAKVNYYATPRVQPLPDSLVERIAAECEVAIVGLGN